MTEQEALIVIKEMHRSAKNDLEWLKSNLSTRYDETQLSNCKAIEIAEKALEKQINGGWLPCSEGLPITENKNQKRVAVFVTTDTGFTETMYYEFESKMFWTTRGEYNRERWKYDGTDFKVIAWRPLLNPYKENKQ